MLYDVEPTSPPPSCSCCCPPTCAFSFSNSFCASSAFFSWRRQRPDRLNWNINCLENYLKTHLRFPTQKKFQKWQFIEMSQNLNGISSGFSSNFFLNSIRSQFRNTVNLNEVKMLRDRPTCILGCSIMKAPRTRWLSVTFLAVQRSTQPAFRLIEEY